MANIARRIGVSEEVPVLPEIFEGTVTRQQIGPETLDRVKRGAAAKVHALSTDDFVVYVGCAGVDAAYLMAFATPQQFMALMGNGEIDAGTKMDAALRIYRSLEKLGDGEVEAYAKSVLAMPAGDRRTLAGWMRMSDNESKLDETYLRQRLIRLSPEEQAARDRRLERQRFVREEIRNEANPLADGGVMSMRVPLAARPRESAGQQPRQPLRAKSG